jgi:cysteine dioxygenase
MRVLEGELEEIQYEPPSALKVKTQNSLSAGQGTYIHDSIGWHQVGNKSTTRFAVSLHLYSPPIASCNIVCPRSGAIQRTKASQLYSYIGKKL